MESVNRFGTTSGMVIQEIEEDGKPFLLAIDNRGLYLTSADKVDTRMADLNRYAVDRAVFYERLQALGLSPDEIFEANKGKIEVATKTAKKINPLKASKRGLS